MNLLKSVKEKFTGKSALSLDEELEGFDAPVGILMERARGLYSESLYFSISLLQERFDINYQTAAMVMDRLEEEGLFEDEEDDELVDLWEGDL